MTLGRTLLVQIALAATYSVAGGLSLLLAFAHPSASPVWAPSGIALAAGLVLGARAWPAVFVGSFVVNLTTAGTVLTSLGIAGGNTLEAIIGTYLVTRYAYGRHALQRSQSAFTFVVLAGSVGTTVAATVGTTVLVLGALAPVEQWMTVWFTWWLGDVVGVLIIAPAILLWIAPPRIKWDVRRAIEAVALGVAVVAAGIIVFSGASPLSDVRSPSEFITMPLLLWAAYRFGPREAITAVIVLTGIAITGTLNGYGPFIASTPNTSLLLLQGFMGVAAATTLVAAASIAQRRRAEHQLREWSITDPLTGLANYRQLTVALDREIQRSQRTVRPFALILLDLDHLKRLNDDHGHLVGSRALCRVARVLGSACRTVDTAARYGGDEFAIVLPESDEADAQNLADRIAALLASDAELPTLSVSIGVAVSPRDGDTVETLLDAADRLMYSAKRRVGGAVRPSVNAPAME
jgi:diguanylate cyclase (GGDEF)-like protein